MLNSSIAESDFMDTLRANDTRRVGQAAQRPRRPTTICRSWALGGPALASSLVPPYKAATALGVCLLLCFCFLSQLAPAADTIHITSPMSPPSWALLQRELLRQSSVACREYFDRYFDERGYLLCVERWGGDDGPDDAPENLQDWPILHAMGAPNEILDRYKLMWEGHLRQYTAAKTTQVPFARDGMYYKEFPVMFDWLHNGEGLCVFNLQGLSDPNDRLFQQRVRRYAGFYLNEDPQAPNYDPKQRIIRSLFNGSRGPLLRKATALDWAGDPIEIEGRFRPGHGERNYQEMLAHFKDYNDIVGDNPENLVATCLAMNAWMLDHDEKYRRWVLEYVDAWRERMISNGHLIPTNIGLNGQIGGETGGKWYGGVYGWGFTVTDPVSGKPVHRNSHPLGFVGFMNAYLLTGKDQYLDPWRKQIDAVNANGKMIDGKMMYPRMHGDQGWYAFQSEKYDVAALEIWYLSQRDEDLARLSVSAAASSVENPNPAAPGKPISRDVRRSPWLRYLLGQNPEYAEQAMRRDLASVRSRIEAMRKDTSTPDTRLADDPKRYNPACVDSLVEVSMGGLPPGKRGQLLHCRLRYFDPQQRRAGLPTDVAALIDRMTADETVVTLVNINQTEPRQVTLQGGAYGEHALISAAHGDYTTPINSRACNVQLAPGAGIKLTLKMRRYANQPTLAMPWE